MLRVAQNSKRLARFGDAIAHFSLTSRLLLIPSNEFNASTLEQQLLVLCHRRIHTQALFSRGLCSENRHHLRFILLKLVQRL